MARARVPAHAAGHPAGAHLVQPAHPGRPRGALVHRVDPLQAAGGPEAAVAPRRRARLLKVREGDARAAGDTVQAGSRILGAEHQKAAMENILEVNIPYRY